MFQDRILIQILGREMNITALALKFKTTVYVLILMIILVGLMSYKELPLEAAPDVKVPVILVQTIYPGVAPEDIEKLVTNIIERELKDLSDIKKLSSTSSESVSMVSIEFETDIDMDDAYQKVRDKVDKAKPDLPADAEEPVLIEINISEFPMMVLSISADYGLINLKKVAEDLEDRIEQIPGVLGVDLTGGLEREIHIYLDPVRMEFYKIGVGKVMERIQQEHRTTPAGNLELGGSKYTVRIPGEYKNVKHMEDIVIKTPGGNPIKLRDIGKVVDGYKEIATISRANNIECVTLRVKKRTGENIVRIADDIKALLKQIEDTFPKGTSYTIRQDESKFIRSIVKDLENSIITGLLLVLIVLFFSMGLRNASFVAIAIPLSMLISFIVLRIMGITLNMVVLFALILALGMLVDNSIVVVENIFRHASEGTSKNKAALLATGEVAWPIIASTATTVMVFLPLLYWPGIMGNFMGYMPKTVVTTLIASLFVAMVINPVVCATFLKPTGKKMFDDSGEVTGSLMKFYKQTLDWSLSHPILLLFFSFILFVGTITIFVFFNAGVEFFPNTTPDRAQVIVKAPQGTALNKTDSYMKKIENFASKEDNIKEVVGNVGMGGGNFFMVGGSGSTNEAVADLEFKDRHDRTHSTVDTIESIRKKLKTMAGGIFRVESEKMGPPAGAPVSVEISGDNILQLNNYARQVKDLLLTIPNITDLKDDFEGVKPEVKIEVNREKAMLRKVNTSSIANAVRTAINGTKVSKLREGDEEFDIILRYDEQFRTSINDILNIRVTGKDGVQIPLRDVASVKTTGGLGSIKHIDQKRTILVSGDVTGRSSAEVMKDVEAILEKSLNLPPGYRLYYSGESEEQERAQAFLGEAFMIGILLIAMILITQFNSITQPVIILASVVLSLMGVFLGLVITQSKFSVMMCGMGVISLAGVVVNNAIVLIDYINQLRKKHGLGLKDAIVKAGIVRFRPVLLTAITTVLGMLPMATGVGIDFTEFTIDTGSQSGEFWGPMAQAVIFGLSFATILTLIVVPVMYLSQVKISGFMMSFIVRIKTLLSKNEV